jgi:HEAT repeat protein
LVLKLNEVQKFKLRLELLQNLNSSNKGTVEMAALAAGAIRDRDVTQHIVRKLKSSGPPSGADPSGFVPHNSGGYPGDVRYTFIESLGLLADPAAVSILIEALEGHLPASGYWMRSEAVKALARIGGERALAALHKAAVHDRHPDVRELAGLILGGELHFD